MTELIEIRPLKPVKYQRSHASSYAFTAAETSSDSSDDESSSNEESPFVLKLKRSKVSKRNKMIQPLPIILSTQPVEKQKKHRQKNIQQFLINTQPPPSSPITKEIIIKQTMEPSLISGTQFVPVSSSRSLQTAVVERTPFIYDRISTPALVLERSGGFCSPYEFPVRRRAIRTYQSPRKSVYLPKHAKKLVNRFLNEVEYAHGRHYYGDSDSDHSIDDCKTCRRLRLAMDEGRRRSNSQEPHRYRHGHSNNCKICNLLEDADFVVSTTKDHSTANNKKREKHVHLVESFPSNIKPVVETTTTTTTTATQPKLASTNIPVTIPSVPIQPTYYPTSYGSYVDPTTGITYTYDPNWQYDPSAVGAAYDYSSYYTNPTYMQNYSQYGTYNSTMPFMTVPSNLVSQQQEPTQTTTTTVEPSPNTLVDKGTLTYMVSDRKKHKPANKTVVIHTSRNPTPPAPKIIIEKPHRSRLPRKLQSTTVLKERTTQTPHTTTTTYVQT